MPNIVFATQLTLEKMAEQVEQPTVSFGEEDIHVNVMSVYRNARSVLFEAYVKEPTIDQHVGFLVMPRKQGENEYTLKLASFGHPRVTTGIHRAAAVLDTVIQQMATDYVSIHRKIQE